MEFNSIILLIIIALIVAIVAIFTAKRHTRIIEGKMIEINAELISKKRRIGLYNVGPYKWVGKNEAVYFIEYSVDGEIKEGWVKFSLWSGLDWRL